MVWGDFLKSLFSLSASHGIGHPELQINIPAHISAGTLSPVRLQHWPNVDRCGFLPLRYFDEETYTLRAASGIPSDLVALASLLKLLFVCCRPPAALLACLLGPFA